MSRPVSILPRRRTGSRHPIVPVQIAEVCIREELRHRAAPAGRFLASTWHCGEWHAIISASNNSLPSRKTSRPDSVSKRGHERFIRRIEF